MSYSKELKRGILQQFHTRIDYPVNDGISNCIKPKKGEIILASFIYYPEDLTDSGLEELFTHSFAFRKNYQPFAVIETEDGRDLCYIPEIFLTLAEIRDIKINEIFKD